MDNYIISSGPVETAEVFVEKLKRNERPPLPISLLYKGQEEWLEQLQYSYGTHNDQLLIRRYLARQPVQLPVLPRVDILVKDFCLWYGERDPDAEVHHRGVFQWAKATVPKEVVPAHVKAQWDLKVRQVWAHAIYAGRHYFEQLETGWGKDYVVGDVTVSLIECPYAESFTPVPLLAALFPIEAPRESYVGSTIYETAHYSLAAEYYHGPMADQIISAWPGHMVVPCDGAGLFASRTDRADCSDRQLGAWVHKRVKRREMSEVLRTTPPGSLQVLMFCHVFLEEADYQYIRPPYIVVDKYAPKCKNIYNFANCWGSEPIVVRMTEPLHYGNPPFTENLLSLGPVRFTSDHLVSRYAKLLLRDSPDGTLVTQKWEEMLAHPDRYSAMVGMVPLFMNWQSGDRLMTRIVYRTTGPVPKGAASSGSQFYFPSPMVIQFPILANVEQFPGECPKVYIGRTRKFIRTRMGLELMQQIEPRWLERGYLFVGGRLLDFSEVPTLLPYAHQLKSPAQIPKSVLVPLLKSGTVLMKGGVLTFPLKTDIKVLCTWEVRTAWKKVAFGETDVLPDFLADYGAGECVWEGEKAVWNLLYYLDVGEARWIVYPSNTVEEFCKVSGCPSTVLFSFPDRQGDYRFRDKAKYITDVERV